MPYVLRNANCLLHDTMIITLIEHSIDIVSSWSKFQDEWHKITAKIHELHSWNSNWLRELILFILNNKLIQQLI